MNVSRGKFMKIFNFISDFSQLTGVHKVIMDINEALKDYGIKICSKTPYEFIHKDLHIKSSQYVKYSSIMMFRYSIVFIHERRMVLIFSILNVILRLGMTIIYVHHNQLLRFSWIPIFAYKIIAISDSGIENLIQDLNVDKEKILKIHNCVIDRYVKPHKYMSDGKIKILIPAKIYSIKQQIEIFNNLNHVIPDNVIIYFAGDGPDYQILYDKTRDNDNFHCLGYCSDIISILHEYDYLLLYSQKEGLPISLIEGAMAGIPLITNSVGGCCEIAYNKKNAFIANNWAELRDIIRSLPEIPDNLWNKMSVESRNIYSENFTFDIFRKSYINLIDSICSK